MSNTGNDQIIIPDKVMDADYPGTDDQYDALSKEAYNTSNPNSMDNQNPVTQKEMMDHLTNSDMECEKLKMQVVDLKMELKISRQKISALEIELAEAKRKENELIILLEERKNSSNKLVTPSESNDKELLLLQSREAELKKENEVLKFTIKKLETSLKEMQKKDTKVVDEVKSHNQVSRIGEVMEKSMSRVMAESEQAKRERDIAQMHLANAESAFSDVHQKYENCKLQVQVLKNSDESLRRDIAINEDTIQKQEQKYEALKAFAMGQIEKYNQELITMKRNYEGEIARITAQMKRYEIKSNSLMEALQQKSKECEQLAAVYDEMIGKCRN